MKWIRNATTTPVPMYAPSTARKLYVFIAAYHGFHCHTNMWAITAIMKKTQDP
jgi:hypothetical protein